ncbi:PemK-like protein [Pseudomonas aeruginosa]|nr:PemK-like protein [Pseudomonas aeruginosa]
MPGILVSYSQLARDEDQNEVLLPLGSEAFDGVSEALLPRHEQDSKIYLVKKFDGKDCYQWIVHSVERTPPTDTACASFVVILEEPPSTGPVEYLYQTLKKGKGRTIQSVVRPGKLVEVDYGHELAVGRIDGEIRSNKRYCDTIQSGEMHKRRLAIVVNVSRRSTLQVVPITSQVPAASDKTAFEISAATLSQLKFYGNSGKQSFAIANMIETVSTRRVLPPVSYFTSRGIVRSGRDPNYSVSLTSAETKALREALLHSIGVRDYSDIQNALSHAKERVRTLEPLAERVNELQQEIEHLRLCKEVAEMWAKGSGLDLQNEVDQLRALYAEQPESPAAQRI